MGADGGGGDFNEAQVKKMLDRSPYGVKFCRWVQIGGNCCGVRMNWVASLLATIITWGFALITIADVNNAPGYFSAGKLWVSTNFTWLYILTQDVWCAFLIYLMFSKYGKIKLGKDSEKPRYSDFVWFSMLFTCGVAVGLYVFGCSEPLYFYRQPTVWQSWSFDYTHTKTGVENDAQRAQQAIFMAVYHWGIHGWVPYILIAITAGIVSFRWQMPLTIRSCFYPLLGDHALGLAGDLIDALSISTTTFGVCTSLGLGVTQLLSGLQFLSNINCDDKTNCVALGGTWDLNTYGSQTCYDLPADKTLPSCAADFLATAESRTQGYIALILIITALATVSVLSGLDRGIKYLAGTAFTFGMVVFLCILMNDNTWYLLNVMVQTTGYYLQYVVQVGFDCEAFQQLNFEFGRRTNTYWGSAGADSASGKLAAVGLTVGGTSADCGNMVNPCAVGYISAALAGQIYMGGLEGASSLAVSAGAKAKATLAGYKMSPHSITQLEEVAKNMATAGIGGGYGVPCYAANSRTQGNLTHFDTWNNMVFRGGNPSSLDTAVCEGLSADATAACNKIFKATATQLKTSGPVFPRCPETILKDVAGWGYCESHYMSCHDTINYYDDTNPQFMDWWTIFYWAWWITWAPFVGFFVALISRGRTIREVIIGGFICPTIFAILWFSVFGGLAIKMQRTAELALGVRPDSAHALVTCAEHYGGWGGSGTSKAGNPPITPEAKKLADAGYYMLSCFGKDDQIYMLMEPYTNLTPILHIFLWSGLVIYFLTSSDSGSMVDDIISASGLSAARIPPWQKVWWCCTEGVVALALVNTGGTLSAVRNLSIIIGLPFTGLLCMLVPSAYRAVKKENGDEDILTANKFNTQLLDFLEFFQPRTPSPCGAGTHLKCLVTGLLLPGLNVKKTCDCLYPDSKCYNIFLAFVTECLHLAFIILQIAEAGTKGMHTLGWLCFLLFCTIVFSARAQLRYKYNVWGSAVDDIVATIFMWPFVLSQMQMMADTDGADAPLYFADADIVIADMAAAADGEALPTSGKEAETAKA